MAGNRKIQAPTKGRIPPLMTYSVLSCANKQIIKKCGWKQIQSSKCSSQKGEKLICPRLNMNNIKENNMLILYITSNRE